MSQPVQMETVDCFTPKIGSRRAETGIQPVKVEVQEATIWISASRLSRNQTHRHGTQLPGFRIVENEPNSQVLVSGEKLPSIALKLVQQAAHNCFLLHLQPLLALLPYLLLWQVEGCMNPSANSCRIRYLWYPQISRRLTVNTTLIATYCNLLYLDALTVAGFLAS